MDPSLTQDLQLPPELSVPNHFKIFNLVSFGLLHLRFFSVRDLLLHLRPLQSSLLCPSLCQHLDNFPKVTHLQS